MRKGYGDEEVVGDVWEANKVGVEEAATAVADVIKQRYIGGYSFGKKEG